jgi:CheY-like chemotaxis protein
MKGTLTVQSIVDQGTTFSLELPSCDPQQVGEREARPPEDEHSSTTGTVLYVEDNFSNVLLMQRLLARRPGVRLVHTSSGSAAIGLIRECHPDLVLLDSHLPDIPGEEVLRRIWEDPETRSLPVAIVSADAAPSRQRRLLASGAMAYLTKPFDVGDLLKLVDRILAKAPTETRQS